MPSRMVYLVYIQDSFERVLSVFEIVSCQVALLSYKRTLNNLHYCLCTLMAVPKIYLMIAFNSYKKSYGDDSQYATYSRTSLGCIIYVLNVNGLIFNDIDNDIAQKLFRTTQVPHLPP